MELLLAILAALGIFFFGRARGKDEEREDTHDKRVEELREHASTVNERHRKEDEGITTRVHVDNADDAMDRLNERFSGSGDSES